MSALHPCEGCGAPAIASYGCHGGDRYEVAYACAQCRAAIRRVTGSRHCQRRDVRPALERMDVPKRRGVVKWIAGVLHIGRNRR